MSLSSMLSGNWFEALATATPATSATDRGELERSVATVATVAVANPPNGKAANDPAAPDDIFTQRRTLFADRGLSTDDASDLAQRLTRRDLEDDDRRVCLECQHMYGDVERRRCSQWRKLWIGDASMPSDLVATLQRCAGFGHRLEVAACTATEPTLYHHKGIDHAQD